MFCPPRDHIGVIFVPDRIQRKKIHYYLEKKYPSICKASLYCSFFQTEFDYYWVCNNCKTFNSLHYDDDDGGKCASFFGSCSNRKCSETMNWEPFYDSYDKRLKKVYRNVIAFGTYFNRFTNKKDRCKSSISSPSDEEVLNIIKKKYIFFFKAPSSTSLTRAQIGEYVSEEFEKN